METLAKARRRSARLALVLIVSGGSASALAQSRPDVEVLPAQEYATSLEEVIVTGTRAPAWRERIGQQPRWDRPQVAIPEVDPPRFEFLPEYTREEREDYESVRDRRDAEPRLRLFEMQF